MVGTVAWPLVEHNGMAFGFGLWAVTRIVAALVGQRGGNFTTSFFCLDICSMSRINQAILIASFIPFCWLAFMALHELGHVVAGLCTGGTVTKVVVHPLAISRTDVSPNPNPLAVVWAGPILGVLIPVLVWAAFKKFKIPGCYLARFFAGFCLIANGSYIAIGSFDKIGDAGDMLRNGSPNWSLWLFGIITVPIGFLMWHRLGPKFGLGESNGRVDERAAYFSAGLFAITFVATFLLSPRY